MRFVRTLTRGLHDGKTIATRREWAVRFEPHGRGWSAAGTFSSVTVDAPPSLASFAQLEVQRRGNEPFPLLLDAAGRITGDGVAEHNSSLEQALALAEQRIGASGMAAGEQRAAREFMRHLSSAASETLGAMPHDLFFPARLSWSESSSMALPGGEAGALTVQFEAQLAVSGTIFASARRSVETRIGDTARLSAEVWELTPF